jgi:hypothetical protein
MCSPFTKSQEASGKKGGSLREEASEARQGPCGSFSMPVSSLLPASAGTALASSHSALPLPHTRTGRGRRVRAPRAPPAAWRVSACSR